VNETEPDEQIKPVTEVKLDMLNLYVKEMREPNYVSVPRKASAGALPCKNFNRVYLPNGQ